MQDVESSTAPLELPSEFYGMHSSGGLYPFDDKSGQYPIKPGGEIRTYGWIRHPDSPKFSPDAQTEGFSSLFGPIGDRSQPSQGTLAP